MSSPSSPWTLHQLETVYKQGYLEALLERPPRRPAHEVLAASWEAGWHDGAERLRRHRIRSEAAPRKALPLNVQIRHSVSSKGRL